MRKKSLLPIDELNRLYGYLDENIGNATPGSQKADAIIDSILDILIMAYAFGCEATNIDLDTDLKPNITKMNESIQKVIADKTWEERVSEYILGEDVESIKRVVDTEAHRIYNDGQYDTAKATNLKVTKTWATMLDDRVRDTHDLLEGVSVGLDEKFYTIDGDSALAPGGFRSPENNVNCRCELKMSKA